MAIKDAVKYDAVQFIGKMGITSGGCSLLHSMKILDKVFVMLRVENAEGIFMASDVAAITCMNCLDTGTSMSKLHKI